MQAELVLLQWNLRVRVPHRDPRRFRRYEGSLQRLSLHLPNMLRILEHRMHRLPRGRRAVFEFQRVRVRATRAILDDAVHPLVLQDDHSVLDQPVRFRRGDNLHGGEVAPA